MIIECTQCQSDILTEADPYLYQNTAKGEVFTCMDCVKLNLNNKYKQALEKIANAPMSEAYEGCEVLGKTYQGLSFKNLQEIARRAI
tara:strand:- start:1013 stop:1273 length:261 start_codon:yes stop_codon:yes gene_type:complete